MDLTSSSCRVKPRQLRIGFFNAQSVNGHREEISKFLRDHDLDVFLIQETFLKPSLRSPRIAGYHIVRNDRTRDRLGGTLIYFRRFLHCIPINTPSLIDLEASVCRLAMTGHQPITIASVYLSGSPDRLLHQADLEALLSLDNSVIIAGDFNAKNQAWNCLCTTARGSRLETFAEVLNFDVIAPLEPTHYPDNPDHRPDILDIALFKCVRLRVSSIQVLHELTSDHRPVVMLLDSRAAPPGAPDPHDPSKTIVDWKKVSESLQSTSSAFLDRVPQTLVSPSDIDVAVGSVAGHVQSVLADCSRQIPAALDRHWILPEDIRDSITVKNAAMRRYSSAPTDPNRIAMRSLQRQVRDKVAEWRDRRWDDFLDGLKPSHQAFWKLQRSLKSETVSVMKPLNRPNQPPAFDDDEKSECLADSLQAQCSPSTLPCDPAHLLEVDSELARRQALPPSDPPLALVTEQEVRDIIKSLPPRKAPGSDGITNRVIKLLPDHLIFLLVNIFNAALAIGYFPQAWKEAIVIGIPKPGKPATEASSYRPISLLVNFGKLFERVILARLRDFSDSHNLLPNEQFGFRAKHSCTHQVHRIVEHISTEFDRNTHKPTGAVFLDVAKAFDKVWHNGLIYKLYKLGVPDRLVRIVRDFLSNRRFRYRVEGALSSPRPLLAGVPQGSVLSPLLFALYTSDIPKTPRTHLALFADDTAIYTSERRPRVIASRLQSALDELGRWFRKWRIEVNPEKSTAVYFHRRCASPPASANISLFGRPIPWSPTVKYLGVTLDSSLRFTQHFKNVRNRAYFVLGRLHSLLCKRSKLALRNKVRLYLACIRPIMTYACPVFAHVAKSNVNSLQVIQNRFMRKATGCPWYMRNKNLHIDLNVPSIKEFMRQASKRYFDSALSHPNPLVVSAANYFPHPTTRFKRRPRHALTDPDDEITLAIKAHDANRPHTNTECPSGRNRTRRRVRGRTARVLTYPGRPRQGLTTPSRFSPWQRPGPRSVPVRGQPSGSLS